MNKFKEKCMSEKKVFFFLCGDGDRSILLSQNKKDKVDELARLACIAMVFGYRTVFVLILGEAEKYYDEFIKGLDSINGNFPLLNDWVEEFIGNIEHGEARELALELWQERKKTLDRNDLLVKHLFEKF